MIIVFWGGGLILTIFLIWLIFFNPFVANEVVVDDTEYIAECPECGGDSLETGRRINGQWRCEECDCEFDIT